MFKLYRHILTIFVQLCKIMERLTFPEFCSLKKSMQKWVLIFELFHSINHILFKKFENVFEKFVSTHSH